MDATSQNTNQIPQQTRPLADPAAAQPAPPQIVINGPGMVPAPTPQVISIGTEQGPIQLTTDKEDDSTKPQAGVIQQSTPEVPVLQAVPQEVAQVTTEVIRPAVPEVVIPPELQQFVHKPSVPQSPTIPPELQNLGVTHTIPQVAVPENSDGITTLPLSYQEAVVKEKAFRVRDSMKWLAGKIHFYWRKINSQVYK